jgi:hypothetical protein
VKVWLVCLVKRGFIQEPEIFCSASGANRRKRELLNDLNPAYDEIGVFRKRITATISPP